jgi:hypothetical protein
MTPKKIEVCTEQICYQLGYYSNSLSEYVNFNVRNKISYEIETQISNQLYEQLFLQIKNNIKL